MKKILGTILFCGMAISANAAEYYLTNGGTSSGGAWLTTTGTVMSTITDSLKLTDGTATHTVNAAGSTYYFNIIYPGSKEGSDHTLTIHGGTWSSHGSQNGMLDMGGYGTGRITLQGGANMTVSNGVLVGIYDGSHGELTVTGTDTVLNVTGGNAIHVGGSVLLGDYNATGTLTVSDNAQVIVQNGLNIGYGKGTGTVNILSGASVSVSDIYVYGTMNAANSTVTVGSQLHVGGLSASAENPGVVNVNEGGKFNGGVTFVHSYGTLVINTSTPGSSFSKINLQRNGTLIINAPYTVAHNTLSLIDYEGSTLGTGGNLAVNHARATVYLNTGTINLLSNKGILYCNDNSMSPTVHFVRTDTVYGGEMDAYWWIAGHVNIGTAQTPVRMNPDPISNNDRRENYRFLYLGIGENGETGYVEFEDGIMRISSVNDTLTKGLIIGDENANSNGTLVLKTGGEIHGNQNASLTIQPDVMVGKYAGTGRLILANGAFSDSRVQVWIGENGTLEIGSGAYAWNNLQMNKADSFLGKMEITGGILDLQGRSLSLNKLNSSSQYNDTNATGSVNNTGTMATVTLNNTVEGAYDSYSITGNLNVQFGTAGQTGTVQSKNGNIDSTGEIAILSDTSFENTMTSGNRLSVDTRAMWEILFNPSEPVVMDLGDVDVDGTLEVSFSESWKADYGYIFKIFTADNLAVGSLLLPDGFQLLSLDGGLTIGEVNATPEPSTWSLMILGFFGMVWLRRVRKVKS